MFKRNSLALLFVLLSPVVNAAETSDWMRIEQIGTGWDKNRIVLTMAGIVPDPFSCTESIVEDTVAHTDPDQINDDIILSVALSAHMGGKEVQLVISTTECSAGGGKPRLMAIKMR